MSARLEAGDVRAAVAEVISAQCDEERYLRLERELWSVVLASIAEGCCKYPAACASEALRTREVDLERWRRRQ